MEDDKSTIDGILAATEVLEAVATDRSRLRGLSEADRIRFVNAAGDVFCPDVEGRRQRVKALRRRDRAEKIARDEDALAATGIRTLRARPVYTTPNVFAPADTVQTDVDVDGAAGPSQPAAMLTETRHCYICKRHFSHVHRFYDQLCPDCAELNWVKRAETTDLSGRVALLTGGRVKIGYQAGIKLLRAGAGLIVTTRFPRDAAARYAGEADFDEWGDRLEIYGLDLRHTPSVEAFCHHLETTRDRLDFIVNNACQTVRRPPDFYRHMMEQETASLTTMPAAVRALLGPLEGRRGDEVVGDSAVLPGGPTVPATPAGVVSSALLSQARFLPDEVGVGVGEQLFPSGRLDQDLQQVDLRDRNSWRLTLDQVSSVELLETQLVNAVAPFVLNARLKALMLRSPGGGKHIVNVSAVEGQFYRRFKTTRHPHTNMAKAALNMMTRTSATDYHGDGIHMNSVDTGWVSDEDPLEVAERKAVEQRFRPPLDIVDGAARIVDPIISGHITGTHVWGQFLKDYHPTDW